MTTERIFIRIWRVTNDRYYIHIALLFCCCHLLHSFQGIYSLYGFIPEGYRENMNIIFHHFCCAMSLRITRTYSYILNFIYIVYIEYSKVFFFLFYIDIARTILIHIFYLNINRFFIPEKFTLCHRDCCGAVSRCLMFRPLLLLLLPRRRLLIFSLFILCVCVYNSFSLHLLSQHQVEKKTTTNEFKCRSFFFLNCLSIMFS